MNSDWANFVSRSRLIDLRLWAFPQLLRLGRLTGIGLVSGVIAGVLVGGAGSRIAMRISAMAGGDAISGLLTENGNVVGEITISGTIFLLIAGAIVGTVGGFAYVVSHRWLPKSSLWKGLAFGILLLLVLGSLIIEGDNRDFAQFGPPILNIGLFASLFILYGVLLPVIAKKLDRIVPAPP